MHCDFFLMFVVIIHEEVYFCIKNLKDASPQIFNADLKPLKHFCPLDSNTSLPFGITHTHTFWNNKTCSNSNCSKKDHENFKCVIYSGRNIGNYSTKW